MFSASGATLQPPESGGAAQQGGGAQAASSGGGAASIMGEIGDEDSKGAAGELGGDERGFLGGGSGGNRWPRQETLALLQIRSDMDAVFRDSSLKGPLWEEVSRKMADLGFHRSSKKCKEKFENVYKYHKRTKEGRAGKSDGKTYRFFDQLQALESHHQHSSMMPAQVPAPAQLPPPPPRPPAQAAVPISMAMPPPPQQPPSITTTSTVSAQITVPSTTLNPVQIPQSSVGQQISKPSVQAPIVAIHQIPAQVMQSANAVSFPSSPSGTETSSSSSTSSDEEILGMRRKRKRKWKDFFERLMKKVIVKQEDLQKKFLEAIEKREHDRTAREEAWKVQEMVRLNREHEILIQERSMAAAKDAALISFLQKLSNQQQIPLPPTVVAQPQSRPPPPPAPAPTSTPTLAPAPAPPVLSETPERNSNSTALQVLAPQAQAQSQTQTQQLALSTPVAERTNNGDPSSGYLPAASSSRWPKAEVEALINLRTVLDQKYHENGPKGPLWEEISTEMKKIGYNRNAKRCKEKWENINKYFKKVKESNKKRPEDSKTCPYFHQLDALYRQKNKGSHQPAAVTHVAAGVEAMATPIMARPEQQWPLPLQQQEDEDEDDDEEDEDDDQGGGYEIVANTNNASSMGGAAAAAAASHAS